MKGKETVKEILCDFRKIAPNTKIIVNKNIVKFLPLNDKGKEELWDIWVYCENDDLNHYDIDINFDNFFGIQKSISRVAIKIKGK